jgi:hypothetical protein
MALTRVPIATAAVQNLEVRSAERFELMGPDNTKPGNRIDFAAKT